MLSFYNPPHKIVSRTSLFMVCNTQIHVRKFPPDILYLISHRPGSKTGSASIRLRNSALFSKDSYQCSQQTTPLSPLFRCRMYKRPLPRVKMTMFLRNTIRLCYFLPANRMRRMPGYKLIQCR